ncbi:MAG TPA: hypothetical protein DD435_03225 [Cyanobacteria bacterium UBA8530]|nr:hypothetical protein [Cyanobacteria bacterium UBA8530]
MRNRSFAVLALSLLLAGCTSFQPLSLEKEKNAFSAKGIEGNVVQANLERTLAVLSGKEPLPDGTSLSERASAEAKRKVRDFLVDAFGILGCTLERQAYKTGENLLFTLPAASPSLDYVLIGAHYDTVRCAGADDNGSATAAVLESARVLAGLSGRKVNLLFAFFDEEEKGLLGSTAMARELKKRALNVLAVHTLDMVGFDGDGDGVIEVERPDGVLWAYYQQSAKSHSLKSPLFRTNAGSTDHDAFRAAGFPSVGLCEEWTGGDTTPFYHRAGDTYATVNFAFLTAVTRLLVATAGDQALSVPPPAGIRVIAHDLFPGRERTFLPF